MTWFRVLCALAAGLCSTAPATAAETIPFRWTPGQIEVEVSVNGAPPVWFIVDTGAEYSIVDQQYAASLGVAAASRGRARFAEGVTLRVGAVVLPDREVMIVPLDNFRRQNRAIVGLIGYDFFADSIVTIDFRQRTLVRRGRDAFQPPAGAVLIPISFAGRLPAVAVTVRLADGRSLEARVIIDTGASQPIVLRYPFADANGLLPLAREQPSSRAGSIAGSIAFLRLPVAAVGLGAWSFKDLRLWIYPTPKGAGGYTATDGVLGNDLLARFRLTIDYAGTALYLEPRDLSPNPP